MNPKSLLLAAIAAFSLEAAAAEPAVKLEPVPGSAVKRVILEPRAAERLGIETGHIADQAIARRQMVGGLVMPPPGTQAVPRPGGGFAGFGQVAAPPEETASAGATAAGGEAWVQVTLSEAEWERVAKDRPARILPLATRGQPAGEILARPSGMPPREDGKRSMLRLYYVVAGNDHGLALNKRMRVELPLSGSDEKHKVVPYGAVYYDAKGQPWVYVSKAPLTFERQRIAIDRIAGDAAVLSDGPPVGTRIVTVGAALLYGAEIFGK